MAGWWYILVSLPAFQFAPQLIRARQNGMIDYGDLASSYVEQFDKKWIRSSRRPDNELLGSADVQSLADLSNSYNVIQNMRSVPISLSQIFVIATYAALPGLPLVLFVFSLDEIVIRLVRTLLAV